MVSVLREDAGTGDVALAIHATRTAGMRSFGFEMTYPSWLEYARIDRTEATGKFLGLDARVLGEGRLRAGGYSYEPVEGEEADMVVLRFRRVGEAEGGTVVVESFVDGLEGADRATYAFERGENGTPEVTGYRLHQNHPNPFNPSTTIRYEIPEGEGSEWVTLTVYDVEGRRVKDLDRGYRPGGVHAAEWDGRDEAGRAVSSGVYFYVLRAGSETLTRKMALLR